MKSHTAKFWAGNDEYTLSSPDIQMLYASLGRYIEYDLLHGVFGVLLAGAKRIVDVGACLGTYSLLFHSVAPTAEIISLEPSGHTFPYLLRNTQHIPQIQQLRLAASDKAETLSLSIPSKEKKPFCNMGTENCGIISAYGGTDMLKSKSLAVRLDELVDTVDFIKIDAEGHDYPVLLGAQRLLKEARPTVMVEFLQHNFEMGGHSHNDVNALFRAYNYMVFAEMGHDFVFKPIETISSELSKKKLSVELTEENTFKVLEFDGTVWVKSKAEKCNVAI